MTRPKNGQVEGGAHCNGEARMRLYRDKSRVSTRLAGRISKTTKESGEKRRASERGKANKNTEARKEQKLNTNPAKRERRSDAEHLSSKTTLGRGGMREN